MKWGQRFRAAAARKAGGRAEALTPLFDHLAERYDQLWTHTAIGRAQREQVWRAIDPLFGPGDRVIDIGCGTGDDAAHLAGRGVSVHAIDPSPAMIAVAQRRGTFCAEIAELEDVSGIFDGALSNFGALNCLENLEAVACQMARLVRPGGRAALCFIGRFCAWETLHYALRLDFRRAFRRLHGRAESSLGTVYYPAIPDIRVAFSPYFACERWTGIGMLVPPSYARIPDRFIRILAVLDRYLFVLRAFADHRLLILVRK